MTDRSTPDCMSCQHFFVTWEPKTPKGCRAYGFKGQGMPSAVVLRESGLPCTRYEPRPEPGQKAPPPARGY